MLIWFIAAFGLSFVLVGVLRHALLAMQMLDMPGQRRLHSTPIPRGGGLAFALAVFVVMMVASVLVRRNELYGLLPGLIVATGIGWADDRRSLGIAVRLLAHAVAGLAVVISLHSLALPADIPASIDVLIAALVVLGVIASINLHNFIDGANGMLTLQSLFVFIAIALVASDIDPALAAAALICAGAALGFLPWNFPRARIFLGDVGSSAIGYLLAALTFWAIAIDALSLPEALLLHSLVLIDTLATLGYRMVSGRRWWRAHREHLYQWLVRGGRSHAGVVISIQMWNLLVVLPLLWWMQRWSSTERELVASFSGQHWSWPWWLVFAAFVVGTLIRGLLKRRLLLAHRAK